MPAIRDSALTHRIDEFVGTEERHLYYSPAWQVLEERIADTPVTQYVWSPVYIDAMILRDRSVSGELDERLWVTHDANFNVTALSNSNREVVERFSYTPFGVATVHEGDYAVKGSSDFVWQYRHQGGRWSAESNLGHFRNRELSQSMGRFTTIDPLEYLSGDTNIYRLVANSPIRMLDPFGLAAMILELVTPLKTVQQSLEDGIIGYELRFNYIYKNDGARRHFLEVNKLHKLTVTCDGEVTELTNYIIDQTDIIDAFATSQLDESFTKRTQAPKDPKKRAILYVMVDEKIAGLSGPTGEVGGRPGYRRIKGKDARGAEVTSGFVGTREQYNLVLKSILQQLTTTTKINIYYDPGACTDAKDICKGAMNAADEAFMKLTGNMTVSGIIGKFKGISLGDEQFELLSYPEVFGINDPLIGKNKK